MKINLDGCEGIIPDADHNDVLVAVACKLMNQDETKIQFIVHPTVKILLRDIEGVKIYSRRKVHAHTFVSWSKLNKKWIGRYGIFPELRNQINSK